MEKKRDPEGGLDSLLGVLRGCCGWEEESPGLRVLAVERRGLGIGAQLAVAPASVDTIAPAEQAAGPAAEPTLLPARRCRVRLGLVLTGPDAAAVDARRRELLATLDDPAVRASLRNHRVLRVGALEAGESRPLEDGDGHQATDTLELVWEQIGPLPEASAGGPIREVRLAPVRHLARGAWSGRRDTDDEPLEVRGQATLSGLELRLDPGDRPERALASRVRVQLTREGGARRRRQRDAAKLSGWARSAVGLEAITWSGPLENLLAAAEVSAEAGDDARIVRFAPPLVLAGEGHVLRVELPDGLARSPTAADAAEAAHELILYACGTVAAR